MQNGVRNGKDTQFSSDKQPSPEAKSMGWQRKRQKKMFMDRVAQYMEMTIDEFETLENEMNSNKSQYTVNDKLAYEYITMMYCSNKLLMDWIDRHVGKARADEEPEQQQVPDKFILEIIDKTEDIEN